MTSLGGTGLFLGHGWGLPAWDVTRWGKELFDIGSESGLIVLEESDVIPTAS